MRDRTDSAPSFVGHLRHIAVPLAVAVALAAWAIAGPSPIPVPEAPLRVGVHSWIGFAPLLLAQNLGLIDHDKVHLGELASSPSLALGLRSGTFDAAGLTLDEALLLLDQGGDVVAVLVMDESAGADAVVAGVDKPDMASLRGRRVGADLASTGGFFLHRALEESGIPPAAVTIVDVPSARHQTAFLSGEVDAIATFEPSVTALLATGAHSLFDSTRIPGEIVDVLVVRREAVRERPEAVRSLVDSWYAALAALETHRDDSLRRLEKETGLSVGELDRALRGIRLIDRAEGQRRLEGRPSPLQQNTVRLAEWMRGQRLLVHPERAARLFDVDGPPAGDAP